MNNRFSKARRISEVFDTNMNKRTLGSLLVGVVSSAVLSLGSVSAQAREAPGYVTDSGGNIVRSGTGECVHSSSWTPEMATIEGCDGVVLEPEVEFIEGGASNLVTELNIPAAAIFPFDSAELSEEGKAAIDEYRDTLGPEMADAYEGIVIGHADSTGEPDYNLELSKRRAESVRDYLIANGVSAEKLRAIGRGDRAPLASNDTPEGRAENRRVEILVVGHLRDLDAMKFPSVALFERRSAELTEQGKQLIEKNRETAKDLLTRAAYIEIIGHTDDVGDDEYNLDLSKQRAEAVREYLVETGVDASKIVAVGAGEKLPIGSNATDEGRAKNRRVEVRILGRMK